MSVQNHSPPGGETAILDDKKGPYEARSGEATEVETGDIAPVYDYDGPLEFGEERDLKRGLKQRHILMIALAGTIGTVRFRGTTLLPCSKLTPDTRACS